MGPHLRHDPARSPRGAQPAAGTLARHGRLPRTTGARSVLKAVSMSLGVLLASSTIFGGIVWWNLQSGVETFELSAGESAPLAEEAFVGGVNILLVGSDDRTGQGEEFGEGLAEAEGVLNDVNMVLHLSADHTHATVVSIPRDTLVDTPECTNDQGETVSEQYGVMFNSILGGGGMNCVVAAAESLSGLDIQFAAMVKFLGVIEMSNAVGGVQVCVEQPIDDPMLGLQLDSGLHALQGGDALKFLRTRHGVGDGSDLARISNQQVFLAALMRTVKSDDTLTNPTKLYGIARAATQNMVLSSNLNNIDTLVSLAVALREVPLENIAFVRLPVADAPWDPGRVVPAEPDADLLWELLRSDRQPNVAPDPSVSESAAPSDAPATDEGAEPSESVPAEGDDPTGTSSPAPQPTLDGQTADDETCSNSGSGLW